MGCNKEVLVKATTSGACMHRGLPPGNRTMSIVQEITMSISLTTNLRDGASNYSKAGCYQYAGQVHILMTLQSV